MINPDIRAVIAPELKPGEELLWAEKTIDPFADKAPNTKPSEIDGERYIRILYVLWPVLCLVALAFPPVRALVIAILVLATLILGYLYLSIDGMANYLDVPEHVNFEYGAYALSDQNLFYLDKHLKIIRRDSAPRFTKATEIDFGVKLSHNGAMSLNNIVLSGIRRPHFTVKHLNKCLNHTPRPSSPDR